jgi:hypothetical protein
MKTIRISKATLAQMVDVGHFLRRHGFLPQRGMQRIDHGDEVEFQQEEDMAAEAPKAADAAKPAKPKKVKKS